MTRRSSQGGAALILLLGILATLAILASTLVFVISNQQSATAHVRSAKQSLYAAEAALDSGVRLAKVNHVMSTTSEWLTPAELNAAFAGAGFPAGADVTFRVYDDLPTVNYNVKWDQGGPTSPAIPDNMVWVEATVTYKGETTRSRVLVSQTRKPFAEALPKAVTYSDTGIRLNGSSDIYAVNADGTPDTSGPPYDTSITAGGTWLESMDASWAEVGRFTMNSSSDLAAPGSTTQSLGITTNGSVSVAGTVFDKNRPPTNGTISAAGHTFDNVVIQPGAVGFLSDYFDQAAQASLASESQAADPPRANASPPYTVASTQFTPGNLTTAYLTSINASYDPGTKTYSFNSDLAVTGNLTLRTSGWSPFPSGTTFKFRSLYMTGGFAVTGNLTLDTTALYVGTNFTISGATDTSIKDWLGSVYVKAVPSAGTGDVNWSGTASVTSRDYTNPAADPQPMWMGDYFSRTGTYNDDYGPIWVPGNSTTSVVLESTGNSTVMCPLLCTTEKTRVSGHIDFGTREHPMVYFFMCDNNGIYPQVVDWAGTGTFYGLMVINESTINFTNGVSGTPSVDGAVFAGCPYDPTYTSGLSKSDIVLNGNCSIAYDESVVGAIATSSLKTTVLVTETVPGAWQQLPPVDSP